MYKIVEKRELNPTVVLMEIEAPLVAKKAEPGQFIILRTDEEGERIPLTVADFDRSRGTVTIIFQIVGATTKKLSMLEKGDCLQDFVGPLGKATHTEGLKKVAVVGGGVGCAIAYPVAKKLHSLGCLRVHVFLDVEVFYLCCQFTTIFRCIKTGDRSKTNCTRFLKLVKIC